MPVVTGASLDNNVRVLLDGETVAGETTHYTSNGRFNTVPIDVTLYQTAKLTNAQGRIPEKQVGRAMAKAFGDARIDYNVYFSHKPLHPPAETPTSGGTFRWFQRQVKEGDLPRVVEDCNMMLTNATSSGATIRESAVTNAGEITEDRPYSDFGPRTDGQHQSIYACLHEMGHSLGFGPREKENHWGETWKDNRGRFVKTPCVGGEDVTGACGQHIMAPEPPVYLKLKFSDCAIRHLKRRDSASLNDGYFHFGNTLP